MNLDGNVKILSQLLRSTALKLGVGLVGIFIAYKFFVDVFGMLSFPQMVYENRNEIAQFVISPWFPAIIAAAMIGLILLGILQVKTAVKKSAEAEQSNRVEIKREIEKFATELVLPLISQVSADSRTMRATVKKLAQHFVRERDYKELVRISNDLNIKNLEFERIIVDHPTAERAFERWSWQTHDLVNSLTSLLEPYAEHKLQHPNIELSYDEVDWEKYSQVAQCNKRTVVWWVTMRPRIEQFKSQPMLQLQGRVDAIGRLLENLDSE